MVEQLEQFDINLFFAINGNHNSFFDQFFYWASNSFVWIPVYVLLFYTMVRLFGFKNALLQLLLIGAAVGLADLISVYLFKYPVGRYRPTQNLAYGHMVHTVNNYRGGLYGFVSSHAINFATWSTLVVLFFRQKIKSKKLYLLCLVPLLVGYSRIYLGVHYPADVFCGLLLGACIALLMYRILGRRIGTTAKY